MSVLKSIYTLPPALRQSLLTRSLPLSASIPTATSSSLPILRNNQILLSTQTTHRRHASTQPTTQPPPNTTPNAQEIPAPLPNSGPLLFRSANRALPEYKPGLSSTARLWLKTLPIFILLITLSSLSIFNYQKSSSSTVNSILYALRTSPTVRQLLGDEIYFASRVPWISGQLNQLHGSIDISFWVKGSKGMGQVRFVSVRRRRDGFFETLEWSLRTEDGRVVQLLDLEGARDPMRKLPQGQADGMEL